MVNGLLTGIIVWLSQKDLSFKRLTFRTAPSSRRKRRADMGSGRACWADSDNLINPMCWNLWHGWHEWQKTQIYVYVPSEKFSTYKVQGCERVYTAKHKTVQTRPSENEQNMVIPQNEIKCAHIISDGSLKFPVDVFSVMLLIGTHAPRP